MMVDSIMDDMDDLPRYAKMGRQVGCNKRRVPQ